MNSASCSGESCSLSGLVAETAAPDCARLRSGMLSSGGCGVLVIDVATEATWQIDLSAAVPQMPDCAWLGCAALGGRVYCAPHAAESVLVIDAETGAVMTLDCGVARGCECKWAGLAAHGNRLYAAPYWARHALQIAGGELGQR